MLDTTNTNAPMQARVVPTAEPREARPQPEDAYALRNGCRPGARILGFVARLDPKRVVFVLALWGSWYAAYRLYYAFGGHAGMIGEPRSPAQFRDINMRGGVIILTATLLPLIAASLWRHRGVRNGIVVIGWIALVGCCTHAITNETLRLLSLTGVHPIELSVEFWLSVNRDRADLQDVLLNEPWFFIEGCLWGLFALTALAPSVRRRWLHSAAIACAGASIVGVLSGLGGIPAFRIG